MDVVASNTSTAPADSAQAVGEQPSRTTPPTFKREPVKGLGVYWGHSDAHAYRIMRDKKRKGGYHWLLDVRALIETAGVKHSLGQPIIGQTRCESFAEAKRVAAKAVELLALHPFWDVRQALTKGHTAVIDEDIAETRASAEYQRAGGVRPKGPIMTPDEVARRCGEWSRPSVSAGAKARLPWPVVVVVAFRRIVLPRVAIVSVAASNVARALLLPLERATCPAPFGVGHVFILRRLPPLPWQNVLNGFVHTGGIR